MPKSHSAKRPDTFRLGYPLNIVGVLARHDAGVCRTEIFGCDAVLLADGPMAGRATVLRSARGILLRKIEEGDRTWFEIVVLSRDDCPLATLEQVEDDASVIARWRRAGIELGLPLLVADPDLGIVEPYGQIGSVLRGEASLRRPLSSHAKRRPRFLARRKTGRLADRPVVLREREIIARS